MLTKKIINTGNKGTINQIDCWSSIILEKLNVPVKNITINIEELKTNSYEIIAALLLNEPKKAYLALKYFYLVNENYWSTKIHKLTS